MAEYRYEEERDAENRVRLVATSLDTGQRSYAGPWCKDIAAARRSLIEVANHAARTQMSSTSGVAYRAVLVALDLANWLAIAVEALDAQGVRDSAA